MKILKYIIAAVYIGLIIVMAYATFVEKIDGAEAAARGVYHSAWFIFMWAALVLLGGTYIIRRKLFRSISLCLLHFSFVVILLGAAVTFVFGKKGTIHLRKGEPAAVFITSDKRIDTLPFQLTLDSFRVAYYPATQAPSDFISSVSYSTADGRKQAAVISMNRVFKYQGYRFYQSSFDADQKGSVLSLNYDPYGIAITYFGYILLALSMILVLIGRHSEFRQLLRSPAIRKGVLIVILFLGFGNLTASSRSLPTINAQKSYDVARYQVVYNNRVSPLNTVAVDFLKKIYGSGSYKGLSAEQVMYGWLAKPDVWRLERMILIKNKALRLRLGIREGRYASLNDLFTPSGEYKLFSLAPLEQEQTPLGKAVRQTDEKVGLILMLLNHSLFTPLPPDAPRLSSSRVEAEILYNRIPFTKILFMVNLTAGQVSFFCLLFVVIGKIKRPIGVKILRIATAILLLSCIFAACGYALRWYVGGRVPLSNGYETMLLMSVLVMLLTIALCRRFRYAVPMGLMLSGFTLLVSHLGQMNPQITPLMPVLHSPLLSLHVCVIMASYALLAFMTINAVFALILIARRNPQNIDQSTPVIAQLTILSRVMLYPAAFLLAAGIFLGAVWANISWGAYWSWDPKETWALITLMVYAVAFHHRSFGFLNRDFFFHLYIIIAFLALLMTYFGVNFFMGGMHSYA